MKNYTEKDLWDFIYRADTKKKVNIAIAWLNEHFDQFDNIALWDDLMTALSMQYRMLNAQELNNGSKIWF